MSQPEVQLTGTRRAAILMVLLGDDAASGVYRSLPEVEMLAITQEIGDMEYISRKSHRRYWKIFISCSSHRNICRKAGRNTRRNC